MASSGVGTSSSSSEMPMAGQQNKNEPGRSDEDEKGECGEHFEVQGQFLPGRPAGRYEVLYEDMSEVGVEKKYRKVHCLLCGDGKLHSKKNIASHVKAMHELYVNCSSCGKEFNSEQVKKHTKLCPSKNAQVSQEMKRNKE